jgi:hypothetical protein
MSELDGGCGASIDKSFENGQQMDPSESVIDGTKLDLKVRQQFSASFSSPEVVDALDEVEHGPRRTDSFDNAALVHPDFGFNILTIPSKVNPYKGIEFESLQDVTHLADGSNSNIFEVKYNGQAIIMKMIMKVPPNPEYAEKEFLLERETLVRMRYD